MKRKPAGLRDSLSWAGSDRKAGENMSPAPPASRPRDVYKLQELRTKLDDDTYVDGAVSRIANFLAGTMKKGKDDEQR